MRRSILQSRSFRLPFPEVVAQRPVASEAHAVQAAEAAPGADQELRYRNTFTAGQAYTAKATGIKAVNGFVYTIDNNNIQATPNVPSGWSTSTSSWVIR